MADKERLKKILRSLNSESGRVSVEKEAAHFLREVDALTLSVAEQELLEEGFDQEDLRRLCDIHMAVLQEPLEAGRKEEEEGHPINTLMAEHQVILRNLAELRELAAQVEMAQETGAIQRELGRLEAIAHLLLETESHHQREEEALFPRLEQRGITAPPNIMRLEHEELRAAKKRLAELVERVASGQAKGTARELAATARYIADTLGEHIYKEDHILYPTALKALELAEWDRVRQECDAIGYCSFTP